MGAADDTETATKNGGKISDTKGKRLYESLPRIFDNSTHSLNKELQTFVLCSFNNYLS